MELEEHHNYFLIFFIFFVTTLLLIGFRYINRAANKLFSKNPLPKNRLIMRRFFYRLKLSCNQKKVEKKLKTSSIKTENKILIKLKSYFSNTTFVGQSKNHRILLHKKNYFRQLNKSKQNNQFFYLTNLF